MEKIPKEVILKHFKLNILTLNSFQPFPFLPSPQKERTPNFKLHTVTHKKPSKECLRKGNEGAFSRINDPHKIASQTKIIQTEKRERKENENKFSVLMVEENGEDREKEKTKKVLNFLKRTKELKKGIPKNQRKRGMETKTGGKLLKQKVQKEFILKSGDAKTV